MPIRVSLLQAAYAVAAGTTIVQNVKHYGKLPATIQDEYNLWLETHKSLDAVETLDARAHELDPPLDRAIAAPANICDAIIAAYADTLVTLDAKQQQQFADATLIRGIFSDDLRKIINLPFTEEWVAVRQILQQVSSDKEVAAAVERLALGPLFALATTLHEAYGRALGVSVASLNQGEDTRLAAWNATIADLLIAARYLSKKNAGLYEVFSRPHEEQLARQQAAKPTPKTRGTKAPA